MKTSKMFMLATILSFAVASAWIAGGQQAGAQPTSATPTGTPTPGGKATTTKTQNSQGMKPPCNYPGCAGPPNPPFKPKGSHKPPG